MPNSLSLKISSTVNDIRKVKMKEINYLKISKETDSEIHNICDTHCNEQNDSFVLSSLISEFSVHRKDVEMT